jgi:hypothetical protein
MRVTKLSQRKAQMPFYNAAYVPSTCYSMEQIRNQQRTGVGPSGRAVARFLGLRARIPSGAWISVSCEYYVLSAIGLCVGLITRPEESHRVWCVWARHDISRKAGFQYSGIRPCVPGNRFSMFQSKVLFSSWRVRRYNIYVLEDEDNTLVRNVGIRLSSDGESHPRIRELWAFIIFAYVGYFSEESMR